MKKFLTVITLLISVLVLSACTAKTHPYYTSVDDVTVEKFLSKLTPRALADIKGGVLIDIRYETSDYESSETYQMIFEKEKNVYHYSYIRTEPFTFYGYMSDSPEDRIYYTSGEYGEYYSTVTDDEIEEFFGTDLLGISGYPEIVINAVYERESMYIVEMELSGENNYSLILNAEIEPVSGAVNSIYAQAGFDDDMYEYMSYEFTYSRDIKADKTAKEANGEVSDKLMFSSREIGGRDYDESIIDGYKLVMVNFWEPWCGPCVGEMPDLELLWENYKDKGLLILGFYSTSENAVKVVNENNITYPILLCTSSLYKYMSDYVPTTVFFDGDGNLISEQYIGAKSYTEWEKIVNNLLG